MTAPRAKIRRQEAPMRLEFTMPLRLARGGNNREHHFARHRRVKKERAFVGLVFRAVWHRTPVANRPELPVDVHLVRVSPGTRPMDDDGVVAALKSVRDQVAEELGVDDGSRALVRFTYTGERGPWGVRVVVEDRE